MKKILLIAVCAITGIMTSFADEAKAYFNISEAGQEDVLFSIPFALKPTVTYSYDKDSNSSCILIATYNNTDPIKLDLSKNYDFTYEEELIPTAISEAVAKSGLNINGNLAILSRLAEGADVKVYDAAGKLCSISTANGNGVATVNMSSLPKGVVVIKAGKSTFKIIK